MGEVGWAMIYITYNWWGWSSTYVYPEEIVQTPWPCRPLWCHSWSRTLQHQHSACLTVSPTSLCSTPFHPGIFLTEMDFYDQFDGRKTLWINSVCTISELKWISNLSKKILPRAPTSFRISGLLKLTKSCMITSGVQKS